VLGISYHTLQAHVRFPIDRDRSAARVEQAAREENISEPICIGNRAGAGI
jgi:hypothetical protein